MAQRADDIRHDIEHTRAAMTQKVTILEERVRETAADVQVSVEKIVEDVGDIVENVKATVDTTLAAVRQGVAGTQASVGEMVEHVKGTVEDTVATVKRTFDLPSQTEQHPWPMVGGAVLVGYMLSKWGGGHPSAAGPTAPTATEASKSGSPPASRPSFAHPEPQQGIGSGILEQFKDEIAGLKSVAVGAVMSTLSAMFQQAMPTLAPHIKSAMTKVRAQLSDNPAPQPASMSSASANGARP
jgi:ElaB/YqjD/DUF883 family membrane-anchored ribosome-binding protein